MIIENKIKKIMLETFTILDINDVSYDPENPRIKKALEKFGDEINAQRIHFALKSASDGTSRSSSYNSLKDSIRTSRGALSPITVVTRGDKYICIDGNTRLAIYKQFIHDEVEGDWSKIKATVLQNADQKYIEYVRVSAHLVGTREWPAYEKARYLHYLRNEELMDYGEMIALCGGNRLDIERKIDAYHEMNEYYRDVVDDTAFQIDRYSGFEELQKGNKKNAIFEAGSDLTDFGEWIRDGKIYRLEDVRKLPLVLRDNNAKKIFLEGGPRSIEEAFKAIEKTTEEELAEAGVSTALKNVSIYHLAKFLTTRLNNLPLSEIHALKNKENSQIEEQILILEDLSKSLESLHSMLEDG